MAKELPWAVILGLILSITTLVPSVTAPVAFVIALYAIVCVILGVAARRQDGAFIGIRSILWNGLVLTVQFILFLIVLFFAAVLLRGAAG